LHALRISVESAISVHRHQRGQRIVVESAGAVTLIGADLKWSFQVSRCQFCQSDARRERRG
jgi:hypothetical protein